MIRTCNNCGFILGHKPGLLEKNGVCQACINSQKKILIDFEERQNWLTEYIKKHKTHRKYDCVIGVSGGKDSHMIVSKLMENHGIVNPLLVSVNDEFTMTEAGRHNRRNISTFFKCDHIEFRCNPDEFIKKTRKDFEETLHPLKWLEEKIYLLPFEIAKAYGIRLVFMGEDAAFEYGMSEDMHVYDKLTDKETEVIYMGAIYPYSTQDSLKIARKAGFIDLDDSFEWQRSGSCDSYSQIDSIGYIVHIWCKFPKFGFQRVSDMACRFVREGEMSREQAITLINDRDYMLDRLAKLDFCRTINITEQYFDSVVDKHAQLNIVRRDCNGIYRRIDLFAP